MLKLNYLSVIFLSFLLFINCKSDDDSESVTTNLDTKEKEEPEKNTSNPLFNEINNFVYRGLNTFYLYKDQSPDLADDRFSTEAARTDFIENNNSPESFFERLTIAEDEFSQIFEDFEVLEGFFQGESLSNGLKFRRIRYEENNVFIVITDVVANSPADNKGIKRGMFFNRINGVQMDIDNQAKLFTDNSFTLGEADITNNTIIFNGTTISLNKVQLTENPIGIAKTIEEGSNKIGYLLYNSFLTNFEEELNNEFANFKTQNLTDFILDLRYNGGGRTITANALSGMITGQFGGQVYSMRKWNRQIQEQIANEAPENLIVNFVTTTTDDETPLNSLGLNKLYVITSKEETASSSELVINSLKPYIDVIVIGDSNGTVGKSQGSITLYDSSSFNKDEEDLNLSHKYALQPLVVASVNKNDVGVPKNGIAPDLVARENILNLGVLGDPNEPLLKIAIDHITGRNTPSAKNLSPILGEDIGGSSENSPTYQRMYLDLFSK